MLAIVLVLTLTQLSPAATILPPTTQRVQRLLLGLYPELRSGDIAVETFGDDVTIRVVVTQKSAKLRPGLPTAETLLLEADIHRSPTSRRVEVFRARGAVVSSSQADTVGSRVRAHPEWTLDDISQAIVAVGGRFPPTNQKDLLTQLLLPTELLPQASIEDVRFAPGGSNGTPAWLVDVRSEGRLYKVAVEPFRGRVLYMVAK